MVTIMDIGEAIKNFQNLEKKLNLIQTQEWYEDLPEISELEKIALDGIKHGIKQCYNYHRALWKGTVNLVVFSALLEIAGF